MRQCDSTQSGSTKITFLIIMLVSLILLSPLYFLGALSVCPSSWTGDDIQGCYMFLPDETGNNSDALSACQKIGGSLAEPRTEVMMDFLYEKVQAIQTFTSVNHWWIGLTRSEDGIWRWISSGKPAEKTFWCDETLDLKTEGNCATLVLWKGGLCWRDFQCENFDGATAPVCQAEPVEETTVQPTTLSTLQCENGWYQFSGQCYYIGIRKKTWPEAKKDCESMGATLASIHSEEENQFIQNLRVVNYGISSGEEIWLGGRRVGDNWVWVDESKWDYSVWWNDVPGNYDCLTYRGDYIGWFTSACDETVRAPVYLLCQKDAF